MYRPALAIAFLLSTYLTGPALGQNSDQSYLKIDFKKWDSGMYADLYLGHRAVVDGFYYHDTAGALRQGSSTVLFLVKNGSPKGMGPMPSPNDVEAYTKWMNEFMRVGLGGPNFVMVEAPINFRDQLIDLADGDSIRVYGTVTQESTYSRIDGGDTGLNTLILEAERIETH